MEAGVGPALEVPRFGQIDVESLQHPARPGAQHHHLVGQEDGLLHAVRDEEDRLGRLAGEPEQIEVELLAGEQIDGSERLVHQHERRIVDQRAADGYALAHADGQLIGVRALEPGQADQP